MLDPRGHDREDLEMKIDLKSKLMHALESSHRVFSSTIDATYTLTTDGTEFRLGHTESHRAWKGHHRVAFVVKRGDEWHVTMLAPEHIDLLEGHDAGTTP